MSLSQLEQHIFAYFVAEQAADFNIVNRFFPYGELVLVWDDKFTTAVRKFGLNVRKKTKPAAVALLDLLIERGGYSTKTNDFGGTMHAFQADEYRKIIQDLQATDPIIAKARAEGPDFWKDAFAVLENNAAQQATGN